MTTIQMPQLGETIVEGTILKWLKAEGETIEQDDPLFEISTDKVDTEVPSPVTGVVAKILVAEGTTVPVGTELAVVEEVGAAGGPRPEARVVAADAPVAAPIGGLPEAGARSQILSPLVRRLASEHHLDLSKIVGTGTGGRITKKDVMAAVDGGRHPSVASTSPATTGAAPAEAAPALQAVPFPSAAGAGEELVPATHIRQAIATHMVASLQTSARAWNMVEVNVEHIVQVRERSKAGFRAREGFNLTYTPFVCRAVADALLAHPMVNSELRGDDILIRHYVNLGIAVAYDEGLIVPVVKNADTLNLVGLARAINDLATRARAKKLLPDEVHGATFSITNPGPYGSILSVPIINQPNVGILAFDAIEKRPVVIGDAIAIRHMVYISMSWDHRVIDGALASQFLGRVKQNLETWDFAEDLGG